MASWLERLRKPKYDVGEYNLRSYLFRSILTIIGPLLVLSFYTFICIYFLQNPPTHGVVQDNTVNARWVFYIWFVLAVLLLEWGRAGLANIEAAALMDPNIAPQTASQLMWHMDMNWANSLWWLRALRSATVRIARKLMSSSAAASTTSVPDKLWTLYSCTTAFLLVGVVLSGLTMELQDVQQYVSRKVEIYGPNITTFNLRANDNLPRMISRNWQSGRPTRSYWQYSFYAPEKTVSGSEDYFTDMAYQGADTIEVFAPPATYESVHGDVWGLWSKISCRPVNATELQMIRVGPKSDGSRYAARNYSIYGCVPQFIRHYNTLNVSTCNLGWIDTANETASEMWPAWLNETNLPSHVSSTQITTNVQMIAAADGGSGSHSTGVSSQYHNAYGHDNWTFDSLVNGRPPVNATTGMFEVHMVLPEQADEISIHCDVSSLTGYATLDAKSRTFSEFRYAKAESPADKYPGGRTGNDAAYEIFDYISPVQVLALGALTSNQLLGQVVRPLDPQVEIDQFVWYKNTIKGYFDALNVPHNMINSKTSSIFPELTPEGARTATYKLLGETMVAMMSPANVMPWYGDVYGLEQAKYLVTGAVPWQLALALLACWVIILSGGGVWVIMFAGKRWAPTLNGFEMFKFGAQYTEEVNHFESIEFRGCTRALNTIPGMVGLLPGNGADPTESLGFIGLSELEVRKKSSLIVRAQHKAELTMDRTKAAKTRIY